MFGVLVMLKSFRVVSPKKKKKEKIATLNSENSIVTKFSPIYSLYV